MTPTLFDDIQSITPLQPRLSPERAKRRAIAKATRNANKAFLAEAKRLLKEEILPNYQFFSTRLFWGLYKGPKTRTRRALGGVIQKLSSDGLIVDTGRTEKSGEASNHDQEITIWESLVYRGE